MLIVSGNLSWLNWLTLVLCVPLISDRWLAWLPVHPPADLSTVPAYQMALYVVAGITALLSIGPVMNMLSPRQLMNASFEPLHLVNTYGAFGSITRERYEIVLEGTGDATITGHHAVARLRIQGQARRSRAARRRRWLRITSAWIG